MDQAARGPGQGAAGGQMVEVPCEAFDQERKILPVLLFILPEVGPRTDW